MAVFIFLYFCQVVLYSIAYCFQRMCKCKKKKCWSKLTRWLGENLFFNALLVMALEGYMEMLISGYINSRSMQSSTPGEVLGSIYCVICLFCVIIFAPLAILWMFCTKNDAKIQKDKFQKRWGALSSDIRTNSRLRRAFYLIFIFRRFVMIATTLIMQNDSLVTYQLLTIFEFQLPHLIYLGSQWVRERKLLNKLEMFNEMICIACTYHALLFSSFIDTPEQKYTFGWTFIGLACLLITMNLIFVLKEIVKQAWLSSIRYGRRCLHCIEKRRKEQER